MREVVMTGFVAGLVAVSASDAEAQRRRGGDFMSGYFADENSYYQPPDWRGNVPYDGRFVFARIKYRGSFRQGPEGPGWSHDYPRAETNLMRIVREVSSIRPFVEQGPIQGGNILALDDPELFKYPVAYFSEPGGWRPNPTELAAFKKYVSRGGFVIFDDFDSDDIQNLMLYASQAFPGLRPMPLPENHPIFDSFYKIDPVKLRQQQPQTEFFAFFEGNDPKKRMWAVLNYGADIGELWQFSGQGWYPVDVSNEAYKLGINYLVYALTH